MAAADRNLQPYERTLEDELDWKLLDQLYGVVSQISGFCFETKKFCVTTVFVVLTFLAAFTDHKVDHSFFVTGLVIPICFWFLDAVAYYYQVKLRGTMDAIRRRISDRGAHQILMADGPRVIESSRTDRRPVLKIIDAAINHSMWLYGFLIVLDLTAWALFIAGRVG